MNTLMVLGGSGFFGRSFLDAFMNGDLKKFNVNKIILVSRNLKKIKKNLKFNPKKIILLEMDLTKNFKFPDVDMIIHAAESTTKLYSLREFKQIIKNSEKISKNLFEYLKEKQKPISFIYVSSGAVYGKRNFKKKFNENEKISINNIKRLENKKKYYALNKFKSEKKFLKLVHTNHFIKIARCFTFIGKHIPRNETYAMGNFLSCIEKNKNINIEATNSKHTFRSYLDAKKLINSLMLMLVYKKKILFPIFNIGSKDEISIFNLSKLFENIFKVKVSIPGEITKTVDYYVPNTNKFRRYFDKKLTTNLKNQLKQIFND